MRCRRSKLLRHPGSGEGPEAFARQLRRCQQSRLQRHRAPGAEQSATGRGKPTRKVIGRCLRGRDCAALFISDTCPPPQRVCRSRLSSWWPAARRGISAHKQCASRADRRGDRVIGAVGLLVDAHGADPDFSSEHKVSGDGVLIDVGRTLAAF